MRRLSPGRMASWRPQHGSLYADGGGRRHRHVHTACRSEYDQVNEDRYPVFAADGTPLGDAIQLATVEVVAP